MLPPPTFSRPIVCETGCGFEVWVENDSRLVVTNNWGAAAELTVKDTGMV